MIIIVVIRRININIGTSEIVIVVIKMMRTITRILFPGVICKYYLR